MPSSPQINAFNQAIKAGGVWDQWMQAQGIDTTPGRPVRLSDSQRNAFRRYLESQGAQFPNGVDIDSAGNMNETQGFTKELKKWGPLAAGIAVSMFGIPGTPIAGLLGGGGVSAAAGIGARSTTTIIPGTGIPTVAGAGGTGLVGPALTSGGGFWGRLAKFGGSAVGQQAIQTGGELVGKYMQYRGADRAVDEQSRANREALDWEKSIYADDQRFFEPYAEAGRGSIARLSDLSSQPRTPATSESIFASGRVAGPSRVSDLSRGAAAGPIRDLSRAPEGTSSTRPVPARTDSVVLEAPTGERRRIPVQQAARFIQRGARRVA